MMRMIYMRVGQPEVVLCQHFLYERAACVVRASYLKDEMTLKKVYGPNTKLQL